MGWTDLYLRAASADDLRAACPWLVGNDGKWINVAPDWLLDVIGPVVTSPAVIGRDGSVTTPPVLDQRFHANLRCSVEIARRVPASVVTQPATPARTFAGAPPTAPLVLVYPADLWRRATDAEGDAIYEAMQRQPRRIIELFRAAQTYQSDDELWPLLMGAATELFGADRAAELLAPSR